MSTKTVRSDGFTTVNTTVCIPEHLKDFAREQNISLSQILREGLEEKMMAARAI